MNQQQIIKGGRVCENKAYHVNDSSDYHLIGADLDHHKDGPIFTTVGSRTTAKFL
jgi:hypothetical protein